MSPLVAKFVCFNLAVKCSVVNLLNSGVVIDLLWSGILFSTAVRAVVAAKLLILGILFLTSFILALREALVTKSVTLDISFLTSFILTSRVVLVAKLIISGLLSLTSLILASYTYFETTETGTNLLTSNLSSLLFSLFKAVGTFSSL